MDVPFHSPSRLGWEGGSDWERFEVRLVSSQSAANSSMAEVK